VGRRQGKEARIECDRILIATGRRPVSANLGLEALGIQTDDHGFIKTDTNLQTNIASIYAIGDCKIGPMLAHKAEDEGIAAVETIAGLKGHVDFARIPSVIYTEPEVADIGMNEEQLKRDNIDYVVGKFSFTANSRARVNGTTAGFVKILTESGSDRILGAHILGAQAGELIHELVAVIEFGGSAEDVARMCHAHPTLSEAVREAALGVSGRVIHS
ncbi:MAG: FAD-dependent oxidoreductase, partial [Pseudomonadota bacterium]